MVDEILRLPAVIARTGLRRSSIYLRIKRGEFRPIRLGPRAIGFLGSEIDSWIASRERVPERLNCESASFPQAAPELERDRQVRELRIT